MMPKRPKMHITVLKDCDDDDECAGIDGCKNVRWMNWLNGCEDNTGHCSGQASPTNEARGCYFHFAFLNDWGSGDWYSAVVHPFSGNESFLKKSLSRPIMAKSCGDASPKSANFTRFSNRGFVKPVL